MILKYSFAAARHGGRSSMLRAACVLAYVDLAGALAGRTAAGCGIGGGGSQHTEGVASDPGAGEEALLGTLG